METYQVILDNGTRTTELLSEQYALHKALMILQYNNTFKGAVVVSNEKKVKFILSRRNNEIKVHEIRS